MILVTGGAGFIGSHLVRALVGKGYKVRVLDILLRGGLDRIKPLIDSGQVEFVHGDIRYDDTVDAAMQEVDTVFHLAATSINRSKEHVQESNDINLQGTINIARSFMRQGSEFADGGKFVFASSASVYGEPNRLPMCETDEPKPITPYCWAKYQSEIALKTFADQFGLKYVILRYFNVYGPGQNTDAHYTAVIPFFIRQLLRGERLVVNGDGTQSMDLINVRDIVRANLLATDESITSGIFNVGSGCSTTIQALAEMLRDKVNPSCEIVHRPGEPPTVTRRQADMLYAAMVLRFEPLSIVPLEDGLDEVIDYERSCRDVKMDRPD